MEAASAVAPPAIELEHAVGYNAGFSNCATLGPGGDEFVYTAGACVVLSRISDAHDQTFLRGHNDDVRLVRVSPSGRVLVTAQRGTSSDVAVWDVAERRVQWRFAEHEHGVSAIALSDDERLLLTVGSQADAKVFIWDLSNGGVVATMRLPRSGEDGEVADCCWGGLVRDVKRRAGADYQFCILYSKHVLRYCLSPATGVVSPVRTDTCHTVRRWTCAAYSAEGDLLFAGSESGDLCVITTLDGVVALTHNVTSAGIRFISVAPEARPQAPEAAPDGGYQYARFGDSSLRSSRLFIGGGAGGVIAVRIADHSRLHIEELGRVDLDGPASSLSLISTDEGSPEVLAGTGTGCIARCRPYGAQRGVTMVSVAPLGAVSCLAFHGLQSDRFASGSADGVVRVWDLSTYGELARGAVGTGAGRRVKGTAAGPAALEPGRFGGQGANVGGRDKGCAGQGVAEPLCLSYIGQADIVLSGWSDGAVRCFDALNGEQHWALPTAHRAAVTTIVHAATVKFFATGGDAGEVKVWDMHTRELVRELKEHSQRITGLQLFADGAHLLTASRDRSILVWDLRTGKRVAQNTLAMGHVTGALLCPNQTNVISSGTDKRVTLWDLRQHDPVKQVRYVSKYADAVPHTIAGDHTGRFFATGGTDQVVKLWDQNSLSEIQSGVGHSGTISCVRFAPDDKQILSSGTDKNILVWNLYAPLPKAP